MWRWIPLFIILAIVVGFMNFDQVRAQIKRLQSYSKTEWTFEDYPVRTWKNPNAGEDNMAYGAGLTNWTLMVEHGKTPDEAIIALKKSFEAYRSNKNGDNMPRPGAYVPVEVMFESTENIDRYTDIAKDFLPRIVKLNYDDGFFSDVTRLDDFVSLDPPEGGHKQRVIDRIKVTYSVDVTDIYDEPLWVILDRIRQAR